MPCQKRAPWRSEAYRRYVAALPCFACGIAGYSQAAHGNRGKGMAQKVSDSRIFPLCGPHEYSIGCHQMFDLCIDMTKTERADLEDDYIERMQNQARADGWALKEYA